MKINWKVLVAVTVIMIAIVWGANSLIIRSYSGTDLDFGIGSGPVKMTNTSDTTVPVKLTATSLGTFTVSSNIEGVSGKSISQGSGKDRTQLFEFLLPPGESELNVFRGTNVKFIADTDASLKVAVTPLNAEDSQNRLSVAVVIVFGALFYLSHLNGHRWISASRRQKARDQAAAQELERQNFNRMYKRG